MSEHTELQAWDIPEGPVQQWAGGGVRQAKAVGMMAGGRPGAGSTQDFRAAGVGGAFKKVDPCIREVVEARGLLLITAFPSLLKLVC